jgi:hypothetical protein
MKFTVLPETTLGKWAVGLGIAFIIFIMLKMVGLMPLPTFAIAAIGLAGFILSLVAIFRYKDRSLLHILPLLTGALILFWTAAELIFPH